MNLTGPWRKTAELNRNVAFIADSSADSQGQQASSTGDRQQGCRQGVDDGPECRELVAGTALAEDIAGAADGADGVTLLAADQRLAEAADVYVHGTLVDEGIAAPDAV